MPTDVVLLAARLEYTVENPTIAQAVLDCVADGIIVADRDGTCIVWNKAAELLLSSGLAEVPLTAWPDHYKICMSDARTPLPPKDVPLVRAIRGESVDEVDLFVLSPGQPQGLWLTASARPLVNEAGTRLGGVMNLHDCTDRVREQDRVHALVLSSTDGMLLVDGNGEIVTVNAEAERVFGFTCDELVGRMVETLIPARFRIKHREDRRSFITRSLERPIGLHRDVLGRHRDGREFPIEIGLQSVELQEQIFLIATIRDISERKRIEQQFRTARQIQQALLPKVVPAVRGFDIAGRSVAAEATGGDFYDFIPTGNEDSALVVALGDVSGHGFGPAILAGATHSYLRALTCASVDLAEVMSITNRRLAHDTQGERFVSLLLLHLAPLNRSLRYSCAGHPAGHVVSGSGAVKCRMDVGGLLLGVLPESSYEVEPSIRMDPGDVVVLVSDGLLEAHSAADELFGNHRVLEVVQSRTHQTADEIVNALFDAVTEFRAGAVQEDDQTAVVIKASPVG